MITVIPFFDHRYPVYRLRRPSEALCNFSLTSRTISKKKKKEKTERNRLGLVSSSIENSSTRHFVSWIEDPSNGGEGEDRRKKEKRRRERKVTRSNRKSLRFRSTFRRGGSGEVQTACRMEVENGMNGSTTVDRSKPRILEIEWNEIGGA